MKSTSSSRGRILVVDDDPLIRDLLVKIMSRQGMDADTAKDGVEALRCLESTEYEAVVLDLMMPRLNGFEVIRHLGERPPEERPIVVVVTAFGDEEWRDLDPSVVTGVVRKPFEVRELGKLLQLCIDREISDKNATRVPNLGLLYRRS